MSMTPRRFLAALALTCAGCADSTAPSPEPSPGPSFTIVDVGEYTSCGLTRDGVAYCWGKNSAGQLGRGDTISDARPKPVAGNVRFAHISVGDNHACGVSTAGQTFCWGQNQHGQVGNGSTTSALIPVAVAGAEAFDRVSAGLKNTCALRADGAAYCWGRNEVGTLGTGEMGADSPVPVPVTGGLRFRMVSVGGGHACGVTNENRAYCWGAGADGALGNGSNLRAPSPAAVLGDLSFSVVRAGVYMTCGLTTEGEAYCWGFNGSGGLGLGSINLGEQFSRPQKVATNQRFISLSTGGQHSCAVTAQGAAYCWGWNMYANLGTGNQIDSYTPAPMGPGIRWTSVEVRFLHGCGVNAVGETFCWGSETHGELGMENPPERCAVGGRVYRCAMQPTRVDAAR